MDELKDCVQLRLLLSEVKATGGVRIEPDSGYYEDLQRLLERCERRLAVRVSRSADRTTTTSNKKSIRKRTWRRRQYEKEMAQARAYIKAFGVHYEKAEKGEKPGRKAAARGRTENAGSMPGPAESR